MWSLVAKLYVLYNRHVFCFNLSCKSVYDSLHLVPIWAEKSIKIFGIRNFIMIWNVLWKLNFSLKKSQKIWSLSKLFNFSCQLCPHAISNKGLLFPYNCCMWFILHILKWAKQILVGRAVLLLIVLGSVAQFTRKYPLSILYSIFIHSFSTQSEPGAIFCSVAVQKPDQRTTLKTTVLKYALAFHP